MKKMLDIFTKLGIVLCYVLAIVLGLVTFILMFTAFPVLMFELLGGGTP